MKSILGGIGSLLLTLGTLCLYAAFAASEKKFALVSDMLQRWPLAGSLTFGIGNSIMGLALYREGKNTWSIVLCMASAWAVVGSSEDYGQQWIRVAHPLSVLLFLITSYLVFQSARSSEKLQGGLSAALVFFSGLALLSGAMLSVMTTSASAGSLPSSSYGLWRQMLAAAEIGLLATYFVGYVDVFFFARMA